MIHIILYISHQCFQIFQFNTGFRIVTTTLCLQPFLLAHLETKKPRFSKRGPKGRWWNFHARPTKRWPTNHRSRRPRVEKFHQSSWRRWRQKGSGEFQVSRSWEDPDLLGQWDFFYPPFFFEARKKIAGIFFPCSWLLWPFKKKTAGFFFPVCVKLPCKWFFIMN